MADFENFQPVAEAGSDFSTFKPVGEAPADFKPAEKYKPEVSGLESFGRGAAQAFSLGYSPQLIAAAKTGHMPGSDNPEYVNELAKQKAATNESWEKHPWLYGTGMVASAIPAAISAVASAPEAAALGGAGLLAESANIGSLAGAGLRGIAGGSQLAQKAAGAISNPIVQGAIYGSSEGDTLADKLSGAAAGVVGAKYAPAVLGAAGKAFGVLGSKIAPEFSEQVSQALNKGVSKGQIAGAIGDDVGFSVPAFVGSESGPSKFTTNLDLRNSMAKASNRTTNEIGGKLADISGSANPNDTGEAIRSSVQNWLKDDQHPSGFVSQLSSYFDPIKDITSSPNKFNLSDLQSAADSIRNSSKSIVGDVEPSLNVISKAMSLPDGLTFDQMHALRQQIADQISFNKMPGSQNLDNKILNKLYGAVTNDMRNAAKGIGGDEAVGLFDQANKNAKNLYDLRDSILKMTGNPTINATGSKDAGQIYQGIENAALKKASGPNVSDLENLHSVLNSYDPAAWDQVGRTYVAKNIAPNGQFSFSNLSKKYGTDLHPKGRDLLFTNAASNDLRQTLDKIETFGNMPSGKNSVGNHIDDLARTAGSDLGARKGVLGELGFGIGEAALMGGLPLKTLGTAATASAAGAYGARNIAKPLSKYAPTTGQQIIGKALQKSAPTLGAQAINPLGAGAVKAAVPYAVSTGLESLPPWLWNQSNRADGGRIGRKSGGRTSSAAKSKADQLIAMVDRIKKDEGKGTEPLLNVDDTTIAKALEIANRGI